MFILNDIIYTYTYIRTLYIYIYMCIYICIYINALGMQFYILFCFLGYMHASDIWLCLNTLTALPLSFLVFFSFYRTTMLKYQILAWQSWGPLVESHMLQPGLWAHMVMQLQNMLQRVIFISSPLNLEML